MQLIVMKGFSGSGKSTLAQAVSRELHWPLVDKDDIKDLLDNYHPESGGLAYDLMFNIARRQLLLGLSVICDSPLTGSIAYEHAQTIVTETHADLGIIECHCSDETQWKQRIDGRKSLQLPAHHQTDWEAFQIFLRQPHVQTKIPVTHPCLVIDTAQSFNICLRTVLT